MHSLEGIQARNRNADIDEVLVGFAKAGNEADFRWLAQSRGLSAEQSDELWRVTCLGEKYWLGAFARTGLPDLSMCQIVSFPWVEQDEAWVFVREVKSGAPTKRVRCRELKLIWHTREELEAVEAGLQRIRASAEQDEKEKPFKCECNDPACPLGHGEEECRSPCGPGLYDDVPFCDGCAEHWSPD